MQQVFEQFKTLFEKRYSLISVLDLGEDSVRYDFFLALKDTLQLQAWEIQLEYPIDNRTFVSNRHAKSKRDEKPMIDLSVNSNAAKLAVEFAFFKRNKVDGSPGDDTGFAFKVLNDFMRLALLRYYVNCDAYFVCVADEIMLGKQLWTRKIPVFPGKLYQFNPDQLLDIMSDYKSSKKIDAKFLNRFKELNFTTRAELIFEQPLRSAINPMVTKALAWKISIITDAHP